MLKFHKEGAKLILITCAIVVAIVLASDHFIKDNFWLLKIIQIGSLLLLILVLQFFRNPKDILMSMTTKSLLLLMEKL